jgi:hypothetical protein
MINQDISHKEKALGGRDTAIEHSNLPAQPDITRK